MSKFSLTYRSHPVIRLAVHLPREQPVFFTPGLEKQAVEKAAFKNTTLTAWFKLNRTDPAARQFFYWEIPLHYVFNNFLGIWKPRVKKTNVIGKIYSVGIRQIERFCLRLLLISVKGAVSFKRLRTYITMLYIERSSKFWSSVTTFCFSKSLLYILF